MQEPEMNEDTKRLINEPGAVGEESLPMSAGEHNDKQEWTYASDKIAEDVTLWQKVQKFFRGGT